MNIRHRTEQIERDTLAPHAALSADSRGRLAPDPEDAVRTAYQRDRDRILHSKAFRRLKHKTQVFLDPNEDHYRTRLTHTLEVSQISRTVARALRLNEDLTEAIALGHDLGHPPFGHEGEEALNAVVKEYAPDMHFLHYEQSLRVVDILERDGRGLNLTHETRAGIVGHSKGRSDLPAQEQATDTQNAMPLEAMCVRICDRIAYVNHDIDDAVRAGLLTHDALPHETLNVLGRTHSERITTMVLNVVETSAEKPFVAMSEPTLGATNRLKEFLFDNVYVNKNAAKTEIAKGSALLQQLFRLYMAEPQWAGEAAAEASTTRERAQIVLDILASMTDRYASELFLRHFFPREWRTPDDVRG